MTRIEEIQEAIEVLKSEEYARFRRWLTERDWQRWDEQIENDMAAGKLDFLMG